MQYGCAVRLVGRRAAMSEGGLALQVNANQ